MSEEEYHEYNNRHPDSDDLEIQQLKQQAHHFYYELEDLTARYATSPLGAIYPQTTEQLKNTLLGIHQQTIN